VASSFFSGIGYSGLRLLILRSPLRLNKWQSKLLLYNGSLVYLCPLDKVDCVAFVIAGTVALLSVLVLIPQFRKAVEDIAAEAQGEVDRRVDETSRLLGAQS